MPDTQQVQEQLEVSISDVPVREGEQHFATAMSLEDKRRRESTIRELEDTLKKMRETATGEAYSKLAVGRTARARQMLVHRKMRELQGMTRQDANGLLSGPCAPATVINFNPVPLSLFGQLQRWTIPARGKGRSVEIGYRGRKFIGSYMTVTSPEIWLVPIGVNYDPVSDAPAMEARYIATAGIAYQFYAHYTTGADDAQHMGGILMFDGDIHTIEEHRLNKTGGIVLAPMERESGDREGLHERYMVPRKFDEFLGEELDRQRHYAEEVISQAHSYSVSQSDLIRNQLTANHITWHNYAIECGYLSAPLPWAAKKLTDSPLTDAVFCPDCRSRQEDPEQYFCRECNAPFDAYKAFMAGKNVSPDRLAIYAGESQEFKDIIAELERRRRNLELLGLPDTTRKPKRKEE